MNNIRMTAIKTIQNKFNNASSASYSIHTPIPDQVKQSNFKIYNFADKINSNTVFSDAKQATDLHRYRTFDKMSYHSHHMGYFPNQSSSNHNLHDSLSLNQNESSNPKGIQLNHNQNADRRCTASARLQIKSQKSLPSSILGKNQGQLHNINSQGSKIIINPKNNSLGHQQKSFPTFFQHGSQKFSHSHRHLEKYNISESFPNKNDNNQVNHKHQFGSDKCIIDLHSQKSQKQMRSKKAMFRAPAFLKKDNFPSLPTVDSTKNQRAFNKSVPKNFKAFQYKTQLLKNKYEYEEKQCLFRRSQFISSEKNINMTTVTIFKKKFGNIKKSNTLKQQPVDDQMFDSGNQISLQVFYSFDRNLNVDLTILKCLSKTGPSSVYLVFQKQASFLYCLKKTEVPLTEVQLIQTGENQNFIHSIDSLIRQSKIGMFMDHPNIVRTYCTLIDQRHIYQLMQFVQGSTLHNLNKQQKRIMHSSQGLREKSLYPIKTIREILNQLLSGVSYIHEKNIVHRDLKPANIFIAQNYSFKIGDFGCSIYSRPHDFVGTLDYVAPEIMLHQNHWTAVDMWALGCIAYELSTGSPPFFHPKRQQTIKRIIDINFDIQKIQDNLLKDLISKLLLKESQKRLSAKQALQHPFFKEEGNFRAEDYRQ